MAKITKMNTKEEAGVIHVKTREADKKKYDGTFKWWKANSKKDLCEQVLSSVDFLKTQQLYRHRQATVYARLYGNMPLFNFAGSSTTRQNMGSNLPVDRPTMNVVQSCIDTLVSRITQSRPKPTFLTDNANYKERNLAKQMNSFVNGELYQTKAYEMGELLLRDASVLGTGAVKIYRDADNKVALDRCINTELLVDPNDALYGNPRQLFQLKLVDKSMLKELFPDEKSAIENAQPAYPDDTADSQKTIADQIMIAEAWHLPSGSDATDGRHVIVCSSGVILDEDYTKKRFPFVFMPYSPRLMGFWGQGLAEQLMGTQIEINKLLVTISRSINLMGVPRVWLEDGSKVVKAHINNEIGMIGTFRGSPPIFMEGTSGIAADIYAQLQRLVEYAYQQSGVSALAATSQKPAGLNSGEAIRNYDDLQSDRFAALNRRYNNVYIELAYQIVAEAQEIAEDTGSYSTVYPNKDGTKEIDLPKAEMLKDPVIQVYDSSSLPRDPSGRLQKVTEMMQGGLISPQEGRRLLDYPDIEQVDKLANAAEERILQILDDVVESAKYVPPDPFMNLQLAEELVTQYYNLYVPAKLEESKAQMLRDFFTQIQNLKQAALPPPAPDAGAPAQAVPGAPPVGELLPTVPNAA